MGKYAQLVIGPAGSGKSTYVEHLWNHCQAIGRSVHCVNLDPAAEAFGYPVSVDVRDLVSLGDVVEEMGLGPNGALLAAMEYLEDHLADWLGEELAGYGDEDYLVLDCPGQIELYNHVSCFRTLVDYLRADGWAVCAVYVLDAHFVTEATKYIAGAMQALAAMVRLELPHVNLLTKVDLLPDRRAVEEFLVPDPGLLLARLAESTAPRFRALNAAVAGLLDEFSLVSFLALDITDEDSIAEVLGHIDMATQYGEDADVRVREFDDGGGGGDGGGDGGNGCEAGGGYE